VKGLAKTGNSNRPGRLLNSFGFGRLFTSREVKARDEERNAEIARISTVF